MSIRKRKITTILTLLALASLILSACLSAEQLPAPTQDPSKMQTDVAKTVVAELTKVAPSVPEAPAATLAPPTPAPQATAAPTQAPPPGATPDPNLPVAVIPTAAPGQPGAIANYNTVIMSGPGINYVVYSVFVGSSTATVIGKSEDGLWWAVSVPPAPGGSGWVDSAWVTVSNADSVPVLPTPPVPPTTELVPPAPEDPQATALVNSYVRTGPGGNYPAYGVVTAGALGRVIGKSEDSLWWVVRLNPEQVGDGYGWIEAQYTQATNVEEVMTIVAPGTSETIPPPPPPEGAPAATAIDYVNVRSGPGTSYIVLGVAPPGGTGEVSGKSSDGAWWQVKILPEYSPDGFGWVSADWVVTQNTENVPVVEVPPPPTAPATPPPPTTTGGCMLAGQNPVDGTVFGAGTPFDTTWVLQNTGTVKWDQYEYDLKFVGAANNIRLHSGPDIYDLANTVEPGWTYNFSVPMLAPFDPGQYGELWQLSQSNQVVCQFYVYILVQ